MLISVVACSNAFKASELCLMTSKSYKHCDEKFTYECGDSYCAASEATCDRFLEVSFKSRTFKSYDLRMRKYQMYKNAIKDCPVTSNKHLEICKKSNSST